MNSEYCCLSIELHWVIPISLAWTAFRATSIFMHQKIIRRTQVLKHVLFTCTSAVFIILLHTPYVSCIANHSIKIHWHYLDAKIINNWRLHRLYLRKFQCIHFIDRLMNDERFHSVFVSILIHIFKRYSVKIDCFEPQHMLEPASTSINKMLKHWYRMKTNSMKTHFSSISAAERYW